MTATQVASLVARGALFVVNHSAGKDSQAMFLRLRDIVPERQLLVIHAELPGVDWPGLEGHIRATIGAVPLIVCRAARTFFEMVEARKRWPSPKNRQCTSDLKRGPIEREIRRYLRAHAEFGGLVVNCMGMRAEESSGRSKLRAFQRSDRNSKAGREWYDWLPIHGMTADDVFATIAAAGQTPHAAYAAGMSRLSCRFCIMSSRADLATAARLAPDLYRRYAETERRLDQTLMMPAGGQRRFLPDLTGIAT